MLGQSSHRMNVLVADDEAPCRRLIQEIFLDETDIEFTHAEDGAEAWWLLCAPQRRFDLGIFDVRMPKVDGLMLVERIRGSALFRHLPVILCTGIGDRDTVARAARLTVSHYVIKPYRPQGLRDKVLALAPRRTLNVPIAGGD